jgi:endo-alpha-1,4-polygalactosaminidase (GH114 family)
MVLSGSLVVDLRLNMQTVTRLGVSIRTIVLGGTLVLSACYDTPILDTTVSSDTVAEPDAALPLTWWQPAAADNLTWQWQLQGEIDTSFDVDVYNLDIDAPIEKIQELKSRDVRLICYFSAGTVEAWRPDAGLFPEAIIGEQYEDLSDERWIDYGNFELFADIMRARMDTCKAKGFDAIETDNVDAHNYESRDENGNVVNIGTNFMMSLDESIAYIRWLADEAHARGLSIGLKNAEEMAPDVVADVDWMLTEDCYVDNWCQAASVFVENNKPVFMTEYEDLLPDFTPACELAKSLGYFAIWRDPGLADGTYLACE